MKKELFGWGQSLGFKVALIAVIVGLMAILLNFQADLVNERQATRNQAVERTIAEWGGRQRVAGPFLRIPYTETIYQKDTGRELVDSFIYVLPQAFSATAQLKTEWRSRGIYPVPLYQSRLDVAGRFQISGVTQALPPHSQLHPERSELWFFVRGASGLAEAPRLAYDGSSLEVSRAPNTESDEDDGLMASIPFPESGTKEFALHLVLNGGGSWGVFPAGADSQIEVTSDHGRPSFGGAFLPMTRNLLADGFYGQWRIPALARSTPVMGTSRHWSPVLASMSFASVELTSPLDAYEMLNRALKYGLLFILVPFVGLLLYEVFTRQRLHPVQYLLFGFAVLMFYLLVLSLSERMNFGLAFLAGAAAVCALLGYYAASVMKSLPAGLAGLLGMAALYGLLYLIIHSEGNALIVGSLFLFVLLATVMVLTRHIDWYGLARRSDGGIRPLTHEDDS